MDSCRCLILITWNNQICEFPLFVMGKSLAYSAVPGSLVLGCGTTHHFCSPLSKTEQIPPELPHLVARSPLFLDCLKPLLFPSQLLLAFNQKAVFNQWQVSYDTVHTFLQEKPALGVNKGKQPGDISGEKCVVELSASTTAFPFSLPLKLHMG